MKVFARVKLATHMGDGGVYVLDEPTTGLHLANIEQTVFTGVSSSGKSSLVFGTIAAESA